MTFTPEEFRKIIRVGHAKMYDLLRTKQVASIRPGRRYLIPVTERERYLARASNEGQMQAQVAA